MSREGRSQGAGTVQAAEGPAGTRRQREGFPLSLPHPLGAGTQSSPVPEHPSELPPSDSRTCPHPTPALRPSAASYTLGLAGSEAFGLGLSHQGSGVSSLQTACRGTSVSIIVCASSPTKPSLTETESARSYNPAAPLVTTSLTRGLFQGPQGGDPGKWGELTGR